MSTAHRLLACQDANLLTRMDEACFTHPWSLGMWQSLVKSAHAQAWLWGATPEEAVGAVAVAKVPPEGEILSLGVLPHHRQKGVGKALLQATLGLLHQQGVEDVFLEVRESNTAAITLYLHNGFKALGRRKGYYSDTGEDALTLHLTL